MQLLELVYNKGSDHLFIIILIISTRTFLAITDFFKGTGEAECSSGPNWQQNTVNDEASTDSERTHQSTDYLRDFDGEVESLRSADEIALSPRQLSTVGYTLKVAVYYDDMFNNEFGANAVTRVDAIMALVDEMYAEDTFQVFLFVLDMYLC